jgi:hypothetical protein
MQAAREKTSPLGKLCNLVRIEVGCKHEEQIRYLSISVNPLY